MIPRRARRRKRQGPEEEEEEGKKRERTNSFGLREVWELLELELGLVSLPYYALALERRGEVKAGSRVGRKFLFFRDEFDTMRQKKKKTKLMPAVFYFLATILSLYHHCDSSPSNGILVLVLASVFGTLFVVNFGSFVYDELIPSFSSSSLDSYDFGREKASLDTQFEVEDEDEEEETMVEMVGRLFFLAMRVACCFVAGSVIAMGIGESSVSYPCPEYMI